MDQDTHTDIPAPTGTGTTTPVTTPVGTVRRPAVVVQSAEPGRRSFGFGSFLAGFLTAAVLGALALVVFLVVSDSDDDGDIQIDVPAVNVETGG